MKTVGALRRSHQITKTRYINKRKRQKWKSEKKKRKSHMQNKKHIVDKLIDQIEEYPVYYFVMAFLSGFILTHLYLTWFVK